jgi:hypothetical protein
MRAAGLLLLLVLPARGQEWITRWADDADCVVDEDSEHEGGGLRQLDVFCVDDDVVVADDACDADEKPDGTWECLSSTIVVDALLGDDQNDGSEEQPLRTLRACIKRFGEDHSATRKLPHDDDPQLVCALRDGVYRDEASTPLDGIDHLLVKPLNDGDVVVFDGTDPLWGLEWTKHTILDTVVVAPAPFFERRPEVIVGGSGLMCANESAIVDGNHDPKAGYGTASPPCFFWAPDEAWVAGATAFGLDDAVAFYERGEAVDVQGLNLPWFWVDEYRKEIYVDLARAPPEAAGHEGILVRVKNASRQDAFSIGNASHRIHVRDMLFYGTSCCGDGPTSEMDSADLRITRSRFLYAPVTGIRLSTTRRLSRGGTPYVNFENNTAEFGEAALFYKGTGSRIVGNYFAFNSFEARSPYTLDNKAQRSVVAYNTLLYNGDKAGHFSWARGHHCHHNLVIGCVEIKILRRVRAESSRRPRRHRRAACSMAWRCRFLAAHPSQDGRVIAEK